MANPIVWTVLIGVAIGAALYYFINGGPPHEEEPQREQGSSSSAEPNNTWRASPNGSRRRDAVPTTTLEVKYCSICLNSLKENVRTVPCGHQFHIPCITKWSHQDSTCPNCRNII